ncbi:hypothetical protein RB653_008586 [Dictyostelium firmibasis]|uniref:Uncharacterized protein n=1 Tax=Dictyostelium firmibasis TaxID=79012 RepID=A0AAN7YRE7_9MYCE
MEQQSFESFRLQRIIEDISLLRLECDWINDQTEQSFKSIIEKGKSDFLYQELIWSIGKELSTYYNIQWTNKMEKIEKVGEFNQQLNESFEKLLKECNYQEETFEDSYLNRLSLIEFLFLQLQTFQLELFFKMNSTSTTTTTTTTTTINNINNDIINDEEMKDYNDELINSEDFIINQIQILSDLFNVEFNNFDNFSNSINQINEKIKETLKKLPFDFISEPFFRNTEFSEKEIKEIQEMSDSLYQDYKKRSIVLQKRLDVTVESLLWSERVADKLQEINRSIGYYIQSLPSITHYTFFDLKNVHKDLLHIIRTSTHSASSQQLTGSILVGKVPDRGGRTNDRKIPMPSFHKRVELSSSIDSHRQNKKFFKKK